MPIESMSTGFDLFNTMVVIVPLIIIGVFVFILIKELGEWSSNNQSAILTVPAEVVTKRSRTSGGAGDSSARTSYYVTFQMDSGDRMELKMNGKEYGMLAEEDLGTLTFQGTRYQGFERRKLVE
ncbi:DUF2500 domain-containing protein [Paenisporosarcina antarctica]|uniref:DUF2500 domain-containing protein n=1 Tax=Paenisporosarcina antarctica TaxID=417367 RepID=A0A4P6ZVH5_9BACL|nr:DUF2500 domain-containing protein [Paenisporosarcina antarctica]QBP39989.1 DUF2500 domain-containing protein [Paenisporosarcina antarctica]